MEDWLGTQNNFLTTDICQKTIKEATRQMQLSGQNS
jgi:hypothetical protein